MARGQGFEPRLTGPKPAVLPLDDPRSENRSQLTDTRSRTKTSKCQVVLGIIC